MNRRRSLESLLAVCALAAAFLAGHAAGSSESGSDAEVHRIVTELKKDLVQAYIDADTDELGRIYSDDFTVTNARGESRTKVTEIANIEAEGTDLVSGTYEPVKIRVFDDVAVMSGHGDLLRVTPEGERRNQYYSFNVFVLRDGAWKYAAAFTP